MRQSILKRIFAGMILGAAVFFIPFFLLKMAAFFIITGTLFRLFIRRKMRQIFGSHGFHPAFTDSLRTMDDAEYISLKRRARNNNHSSIEIK